MKNKISSLTKVLISLIVILLIVLVIAVTSLFKTINESTDNVLIDDHLDVEIDNSFADEPLFTKEQYLAFKDINSDYIGQVIFESEIINEPILFSKTNGYYLRKNINKEYSIQGSVYLDERNVLSDQNIILYGHFTEPGFTDYEGYDPNIRPMFTNLDLLLEKDNYEDNKIVYLFLENEVRKYEVASVYYCPLLLDENDVYSYVSLGYEYYLTSYNKDEFDYYKMNILNNEQYSTNVDFTNDDSFLTLQTCVAGRPELREIVLCKEIDRNTYK